MNETKTDVDDNGSILSGKTLLGVQEAKEKGLKVHTYELEEDEDLEPTGCFIRMFFGRNKRPQQKEKLALKFKLTSAGSKLVPHKVRSIIAARQHTNACKLYDDVLRLCTFGTLEELTKLFTRNRKAVATVQHKPYEFLLQLVSRNPNILKCVLAHCGALDLDATDAQGRTPLYHAASRGKEEVINILVASGANKEIADKYGMRPLHVAAKRGRFASVVALLAAKADVEAPGAQLNKPLHYAVEHTSGTEIIDRLLEAGADINATNLKLSTPLHAAIRFNRPSAQRLLMQRGADIEALSVRWETPVKYAVSHGKLDMLCNLIIAGADPEAVTSENKTALHSAAAHEDHKIVQVLLDAGCKVDPKSKTGSTPLYMAAQNGRIKNAQILVAAGADLEAKRKRRTPVDVARKNKNFGVVDLLEKARLGLTMPYEIDKNIGKASTLHPVPLHTHVEYFDGLTYVTEDHANDHTCTWEHWFEHYVVAAMDWH